MASGTFYPVAGGDDGYWESGDFQSGYNRLAFGSIDVGIYVSFNTFIRFTSVTVPQGATISAAYLKLTSHGSLSGTTVNIRISFNDIDEAIAPTSIAEANGLALTTNFADWDAIAAWTDGTQYDSPSIVSVLQEIVDRVGWTSGNSMLALLKNNVSSDGAYREAEAIDYVPAEKAELHIEWSAPLSGTISEDVSVLSEFDDNFGELTENVNVLSEFENDWPEISEDVNVLSEFISEHTGELSEDASVNSAFEVARYLIIVDTLSSWDNLKWGWQKSIADSLAIADTAEKILGIPVKDWLAIKDSELTNWNGVESVSDSFYALDISKVIKVYFDLVADGMTVADAVKSALELIIKDIFTCVDTALNIGQFQHSISDLLTLEDTTKRFFPKSVSDSFAVADISLVDFLALLQISDSLTMVDTADRLLTINKAIADSLDVLDVVTIKQLIQELMQDGLNISASVIIDGEVYECWVLNTSSFHPSVYSNYEFNSFCIDKSNNICYGCKSDGIYTLEGDTDNGTDIKAGIILPDTDFGSSNKKRFRKAWLAVEGNNLLLKVETESGSRTYGMTDTEISLTRDLKGRSWKFSVEGFDSLDSINLVPIILSKR